MIPEKTIEELILNIHIRKRSFIWELDKKLFAEKSKEYSDVNEIIENAKKYISLKMIKKNRKNFRR